MGGKSRAPSEPGYIWTLEVDVKVKEIKTKSPQKTHAGAIYWVVNWEVMTEDLSSDAAIGSILVSENGC